MSDRKKRSDYFVILLFGAINLALLAVLFLFNNVEQTVVAEVVEEEEVDESDTIQNKLTYVIKHKEPPPPPKKTVEPPPPIPPPVVVEMKINEKVTYKKKAVEAEKFKEEDLDNKGTDIEVPFVSGPEPEPLPDIIPEVPISKVAIYPLPPSCQRRYENLRDKGKNDKAKEYAADCLKDFFTGKLGDHVMDNLDNYNDLLANNDANQARGRLKIVIDEKGVISKVEVYGKPSKKVDKEFTKKMEQAMKQIAAQLRDRGELFSQAKTSSGDVVRMFYFIPINFAPQ